MNYLVIEGVAPWDGEYELPNFVFTNRELNRIKEVTGIRGGELIPALVIDDAAAFVGVAVVVLARHGKQVDPDDLWDAPKTAIRIELGDEDEQSLPLATASGDGSSESPDSSGPVSESVGE